MDCWRNLRSDCVVITNREASASRFAEASRLTEGARSNYYLPELLNSQLGNKLLPMS